MYSQHFGLTQDPFSIAPDPHYLFMSERHREALAHLLYGVGGSGRVAGGGFVLLTGDIGTGKTTICRCFLDQIPPGCHVAYIFNPKLSVPELLQTIVEEFHVDVPVPSGHGAPSLKDPIDALNAFLLRNHAAGQGNVLIIDEAQNLAPEVLEQLRLLTNLETSERKLLQIVLIGQPELRVMLQRPDLEQLAQRVIARFHLDALNAAETTLYIRHRLAVSGHTGAMPFDVHALKLIYQITRGVPRRINLLCGRALLGAWATGMHRVDRAIVHKAATEVFGSPAPAVAGRAWYLAGGVALVAAAVAATLVLNGTREPLPAPPPVAAPVATPAAQATAPAPQEALPKPPANLEEIAALYPLLPRDIAHAWHDLAPVWNRSLANGDPCQPDSAQELQCYRAADLTLPQLRQLNRPGILTLQSGKTPPAYAVLLGMDGQNATLLLGSVRHRVNLTALARLWRGDFATFWRPPPGYVAGLQSGSSGAAIDRLANQLDAVEGVAASPDPHVLDDTLRSRVRAFQRAQGLKPDGQPGPLTFMQLESAAGNHSPSLAGEAR